MLYLLHWPKREGRAWRYYLLALPKELQRIIKASWQRARDGRAFCDHWNIDMWFQDIMPDLLLDLVENNCGWPPGLAETPEEWHERLRGLATKLQALKKHEDRWFEDGLYDTQSHEQYRKETVEARNAVVEGLEEFKTIFFGLWD